MTEPTSPPSTPLPASPSQSGTSEPQAADEAAILALKPELQPIARRHGLEMLDFAVRVAAANVALDQLVTAGLRLHAVRGPTSALMNAQADLCNMLAKAKGWHWDQIIECMSDIGRAGKLAALAANSPHRPS